MDCCVCLSFSVTSTTLGIDRTEFRKMKPCALTCFVNVDFSTTTQSTAARMSNGVFNRLRRADIWRDGFLALDRRLRAIPRPVMTQCDHPAPLDLETRSALVQA